MPIHHGGFPGGCDDDRPALADRGDGQRYRQHKHAAERDAMAALTRAADDDLIFEFPAVSLTFAELQKANRERGKAWGKGQQIPALFNAVELAGEVGELMNEIKKQARYEMGMAGGKHPEEAYFAIEDELGDVVICCSLLANKLGIDLGKAVANKFNKTSEKHGFPHRLAA